VSGRAKVRREEWHAVGELPGKRITRRATGKRRYVFLDDQGITLASQDKDALSAVDRTYKFNVHALIDTDSGEVVVPTLRHARVGGLKGFLTLKPPLAGRIDFPDLSWVDLRITNRREWQMRWQLAVMDNSSGERIMTLRWLAVDHRTIGNLSEKFKEEGEAIIPRGAELAVPDILLTAAAFHIFDDWCTNPGGGGG
jgi:hypothetical protein